ncbi:MAG: Transposase [Phycisphaerales bacterium]|nr:Transposase [Phycisphaerales bacterium]
MRRVIAFHTIITTYGFWLPNDPRGSWSDFVRAWELLEFGPATRTSEHRSLARDPHNYRERLAAKKHLARSPVKFNGIQARAVARGFANYVARSGCVIHACAALPCHAHFVIARHRYSIEKVATLLKGAATRELIDENIHPFADDSYRDGTLPTPWARKSWSCFLDCDDDIARAIAYVERNPIKDGKRAQEWSFVQRWGTI